MIAINRYLISLKEVQLTLYVEPMTATAMGKLKNGLVEKRDRNINK
ncbi:hypothetical protein RV00_GL001494 [Enterococcus devriesei]|uniref:Uncharacterized protein n=1 Tax=Enterococcus devriesei TaxID=319970 RepID=A0A1L8SMF5_9ENTE|nr:hypothetical protein RV00_GL001494 [Enterococcus devriesei]